MQTIVNQVKMTNDYGLFSFISGNRDINDYQLARLTKSIDEQYLQVPIVVNEKKQIIDGQHRFEAAKKLNEPVFFIELPGLRLKEVHRLNTNSKNWTANEYMNGYSRLGYPDYVEYKQFKSEYGFGHNETMALLKGATRSGGTLVNSFRDGVFKIEDYNEAVRKADKITMVGKYYDGYKRRAFVYAMLDLFRNPDYNHAEFLNKLSFQAIRMIDCTNVGQYMMLIEDIYNFKSRNKIRLF